MVVVVVVVVVVGKVGGSVGGEGCFLLWGEKVVILGGVENAGNMKRHQGEMTDWFLNQGSVLPTFRFYLQLLIRTIIARKKELLIETNANMLILSGKPT